MAGLLFNAPVVPVLKLNQTGFFESGVSAVAIDRFNGPSRNGQGHRLIHFRNEDLLFLQVGILTNPAGRIELGGAGAIRITAADARSFF